MNIEDDMGHAAVVDNAGTAGQASSQQHSGNGRAFRAENPRDLTIHENPSTASSDTMDYDDTASQVAEGSIDLLEAAIPILAGQLTASQLNAVVAPMLSTPGSTVDRITRFVAPLLVGAGLYGYSTNQYVQGAAVGMGFESARVGLEEIQNLLMSNSKGDTPKTTQPGGETPENGTEGLARARTSVRRLPRSTQSAQTETSSAVAAV